MHVMNVYIDHICITEDDTNTPKENVPSPLTFPYPKICPIVVPKLINYVNTYHFIIVFVNVFCA